MINFFIKYLIPSTLAGSLFIMLLMLLNFLFPKANSRIKRVSIILSILILILPFSIASKAIFSSSKIIVDEVPIVITETTDRKDTDDILSPIVPIYSLGVVTAEHLQNEEVTTTVNHENNGNKAIDWIGYGINIYLIGIAIFLTIGSVGIIKLRLKLKNSCKCIKELKQYQNVAKQMNIRHVPELRKNSLMKSPFLIGIIKPRIVLPELDFSESELKYILQHELQHYKNRDILIKTILFFVNVIYWFNPLVWILRKHYGLVSEDLCDDYVTANITNNERKVYANTILNVAERTLLPITGFASPKIRVKERLMRIMNPVKTKRFLTTTITLIILGSLMMSFSIGCSFSAGTNDDKAIDNNMSSEQIEENVEEEEEVVSFKYKESVQPTNSKDIVDFINDVSLLSNSNEKEISVINCDTNEISSNNGDLKNFLDSKYWASGFCLFLNDIELNEYRVSLSTGNVSIKNSDEYIFPMNNYNFISRGSNNTGHIAMDIAAPTDTEVNSIENGIVLMIGNNLDAGYGKYIVIEHPKDEEGNTVKTLYAHLNDISVFPGDIVSQGQVIGLSGSTGNSTGPHLHFEIQINDMKVNPEPYFKI